MATKYGISSKTLRQWVAKYRIYGIAAFITKAGNTSYSSEFKTMCVEAVLSGEGSVDDIVAKYNISSRQVLRGWILRYNANRELKDYAPKREVYMADDEVDELERLRRENIQLKRQLEEKRYVN